MHDFFYVTFFFSKKVTSKGAGHRILNECWMCLDLALELLQLVQLEVDWGPCMGRVDEFYEGIVDCNQDLGINEWLKR